MSRVGSQLVCIGVLLAAGVFAGAQTTGVPAIPSEALDEVVVTAREPRYAAPTTRDRIGRIWAPVFINDRGPFRLVLDTGATNSAVNSEVASQLAIPFDDAQVKLRGATGSQMVPSIRVESLAIGELLLRGKRLPIISDALGGAQGILGAEGLHDKRVSIDFRRDNISISRSHNERAEEGFLVIPFQFTKGRLLTVSATMGSVAVKAIIDTGGQTTIANLALRDALKRQRLKGDPSVDTITGATLDQEIGEGYPAPPIRMGSMSIYSQRVTFQDFYIFKYWNLIEEPAVLVGMDALGLLDTLIIDYRRREMHVKIRG